MWIWGVFLRRRRAHTGSLGTTWLMSTPPHSRKSQNLLCLFFFWNLVTLDAPFHQHLSICTSLHCPPLPPRFEDWGTFSPFRGFGGRRRKLRLAIQEFRKLTPSQSKYLYCQRKRSCQAKGWAKYWVWTYKGRRKGKCLLVWGWKRRPTDTGIAALDGCPPNSTLALETKGSPFQ